MPLIQLEVSDHSKQHIERLIVKSASEGLAEMMVKALALLDAACDAHADGGSIHILYLDGRPMELLDIFKKMPMPNPEAGKIIPPDPRGGEK